ncbi:MAG TPA: hypothetical protein VKW06_11965 [Candidatus Angelobacter sp.]|nr:hypothetical protein [Candidatus Angelobacter sp.]
MQSNKLLLLSLMALCLPVAAAAATVNAASCSQGVVQNAINSAASGDTVLVPAGSCTWSTAVSIPSSKGVTVLGAGVGVTDIVNATGNTAIQMNVQDGIGLSRVSGFSFDGNGANSSAGVVNVTAVADAHNAFRIDHCRFSNVIGGRALEVGTNGYEVSGLIDNNSFIKGSGTLQSITILADDSPMGPNESLPWTHPYVLGGPNAIFVEDNIFDYSGGSIYDGAIDTGGGARFVFRHNNVIDTFWGDHGADLNARRGAISFEMYNNTISNNTGSSIWTLIYLRSGSGVIYNNSVTGPYSGSVELNNYRSSTTQGCGSDGSGCTPFYLCDGTHAWDGNVSGKSGWPCLDQTGHIFTSNMSSGTSTLNPLYTWPGSGVEEDAARFTNDGNMPTDIIANREFFNYNASFDGTSGVGQGTLAARPATCTSAIGGYSGANPAYWTTDTNPPTLYTCTSANTWTVYYTPYTYPHPLRSGATAPPAPASLRLTVN